ncbi:hypothetical protein MBM_08854 [Drepanopeziza brunnea f. sp. 'multigermtubi' MB_m1]|uniref:Uncharacterized protein n=1 Tax=Marssonina brunnea f. sp. multigermtubi (strain MB_m1) TaxID=1072389 RepID=K1WLH9_MARBU|nr:uncharacterized protein MBM_08854 [Drepanopeziza brunnea f. sp. 'multigermtubi' MB_m1]EKD13092.1 hypothetical protein MBM_08854 [Drepanopeziza brunnea f. sp. 'multigermtubi' MB_m1]
MLLTTCRTEYQFVTQISNIAKHSNTPWVMQSPEAIEENNGLVFLQHSLLLVAFDCEFVLATVYSERERLLQEILCGTWNLADVVTIKTMDGPRSGEYGTHVPVTIDEGIALCPGRLEIPAFEERSRESKTSKVVTSSPLASQN